MKITILKYPTETDLLWCKTCTLNTIGKKSTKKPTQEWLEQIVKAEHSPIRELWFGIKMEIPYWVSVHFVRHKIGIEHWVSTQRTDRTNVNRNEKSQNTPVTHACEADAQAMINISRKRLCNCASPETRQAWQEVKNEVAKVLNISRSYVSRIEKRIIEMIRAEFE